MEKSDVGPKCWLFSQPTTNTPFDFHIIYSLLILQVDTEEEDNGTNKTQAQCSVTKFKTSQRRRTLFSVM